MMASVAIRCALISILFLFPIIQAQYDHEDNGDVNADFHFNDFQGYDTSGFDDDEDGEEYFIDGDSHEDDDGNHDDDHLPDYGLGTEEEFEEDNEFDKRHDDDKDDGPGTQTARNADGVMEKIVPKMEGFTPSSDQHPHTFSWKLYYLYPVMIPGLKEQVKKDLQESLPINLPNDIIMVDVLTTEVKTGRIEISLKITTTATEESFKGAAYYLCQEQLRSKRYVCTPEDIVYDRNSCPSDSFICLDGLCLDPSTRCDNKFDCQDGSDEIGCGSRSSCSKNEFDCGDGSCIDIRERCDGGVQCQNGRDEDECEPSTEYCNANQFECRSGKCLDSRQVCDGNRDCPSGSNVDEDDCFLTISPSKLVIREWGGAEFLCSSPKGKTVKWSRPSNQPLPRSFKEEVDGVLVIRDAQFEDAGEYLCFVVDDVVGRYSARATLNVQQVLPSPTTYPPVFSGNCGRNQFQCQSGKCISSDYVCDADYDCDDQSDEANCAVKSSCEPNEFLCRRSNKCVSVLWNCDGDKDCGKHDDSDEQGCDIGMTVVGCRKDEFACHKDNQCIPLGYHCDNQTDCADFSDEKGCTPPTVPKPMSRKITGKRGDNLTLTCEAQGVPAPIIVWRLNWGHVGSKPRVVSNSERLTPYSKYHQLATTRSVLTIHRLHSEDEGAYSCEAINSLGSTFASPDTIVLIEPGDEVCKRDTFNSAALETRECLQCWCSGVSEFCKSADNLLHNMKNYNQQVGIFDKYHFLSTRDRTKIEYLAVPSFTGNKLKIYGGKVEYHFFYNLTAAPTRYPGPYVAAYIESRAKNLYYFLDEIPSPDVVHPFELPFTEVGWFTDENRRWPASRSDFMESISQLEELQLSCKFVDTIDTSGLSHIRITESRTDVGTKAHLVEQCECPIGYTGYSCESCADMYSRDPITNECVSSCDCNGHSSTCNGYGTCTNCRDNTDGPRCEKCASGFYGDALVPYGCIQCNCPPMEDGSPATCYERNGEMQCDRCALGSYGVHCRQCHQGYYQDSKFGCITVRDNICNSAGTERINSDQSCFCKQKVEGELCDRCVVGTFGLSEENPQGCQGCQCFEFGTGCSEASDVYHETVRLNIDYQPPNFDGLKVINVQGTNEPTIIRPFYPPSHPTCVAFNEPKNLQYWKLPDKFFDNPLYIYQGKLSYNLYYQSNNPGQKRFGHDVIIKSKFSRDNLTYSYHETNPQPNTNNAYEVVFKEGKWIDKRGASPDSKFFTSFLRQLTDIQIKATFSETDVENRICDVQLVRISSTPSGGYPVSGFQKCACPSGYEGHFCERCSAGFKLSYERGIPKYCERESQEGSCPEGYYYEPRALECQECKCPHTNKYADGGIISCEWRNNDYSCLSCPVGYEGDHCDTCNPMFVGFPKETYGKCEQMDLDIIPVVLTPDPSNKNRTEAELNSDITLRCNLIGTRPIGIRWYRANQVPLPTNSYVNPEDDYSLTITRIQRSDAGVYYCQAANSEGKIEIAFDLYILFDDRPQLEIIPSPQSPKSGDFFSLRCNTKNMVDNSKIIWSRRDGRPMNAVKYQDGSLVFERLDTNDMGQYICELKSDQGAASSVYDLVIIEDVVQREDEGSTVELICRAVSQQSPRNVNIYWLKDGRRVYTDHRVQSQESVLRINGANKEDQGVYTCVVEDAGRENKMDISLLIEPKTSQDQFTIVGQDVTLTCVLRPDQNPRSVYWLKNDGTDLGPRTRVDSEYSLMIEKTTLEDSGMYACVVETYTDQKDHQVQIYLRVQEDPRPSIQGPNRVETRIGERIMLVCVVSGEQPIQVKWMRGNREVNDPSVRFDPHSNALTIERVQQQHVGVWTCLAENTHGNMAHHVNVETVEITAPSEPTIIDIFNKDRAELWCRLGEGQLGTIKWTKNQYPIPSNLRLSDRSTKLTIMRAVASDAGTYTCSMTAEGRTYTKDFIVRFKDGRPKIQGGPVNNKAAANTDFELICKVESLDEPVVRWTKDGLPIYEDDTKIIGRDHTLLLRRVDVSDSGTYTCTAQNKHGKADSTMYLNVETSEILPTNPGAHVLEPRTIYVNIGDTADFICVPTGGIDAIASVWNRKDRQRKDSRYVESDLGERRLLSIRGVRREDEGTFECMYTDSDFIEYKTYAELVIKDSGGGYDQRPSAIIRQPYDFNVVQDQGVRVKCEVQGSEPLEVYWTHNNQITTRHINRDVLEISRVSEADEGEYICYARNPLGTAAARVFLNVQDPDLKVSLKPTVPVEEYKPIKISCFPDSQIPVDTVEWTRHDGPLPPNIVQMAEMDGQSMFIPSCEKEDQGRYICTVYFVGGQKEVLYYTVRLPGYDYYPELDTKVDLGRRSPIEGYRVTITPYETSLTKDSGAQLKCELEGSYSFLPKYEWFHDGKRINHPQTTTEENYLTLRNAVLDQSGTYTCRVLTSVGNIYEQAKVTVEEPRYVGGLLVEPRDTITVREGDPLKIICTNPNDPRAYIVWQTPYGDTFQESTTAVVNVDRVTQQHSGQYTCSSDNTKSEIVEVIVEGGTGGGTGLHVYPATTTLAKGQNVDLNCYGAPENTRIEWMKFRGVEPRTSNDWFPISDPNIYARGSVLSVQQADDFNTGLYKCMAYTSDGMKEAVGRLDIMNAPVLSITPSLARVKQGDSLELHCESGLANTMYEWKKQSGQLSSYSVVRDGVLYIKNFQETDAGQYICSASNDVGTAESHVDVIFTSEPHMEIRPSNSVVNVGGNLELTCVTGNAQSTNIDWKKVGGYLPAEHQAYDYFLKINNLRVEDRGTYQCSFLIGDVHHTVETNVDIVNESVEIHREYAKIGDEIKIACQVYTHPDNPNPRIEWLKDNQPLLPHHQAQDSILLIRRAQAVDKGVYKCSLTNHLTGAVESAEVRLDIQVPLVIPVSHGHQKLSVGSQTTFKCLPQGNPPINIQWTKDGVVLPSQAGILVVNVRYQEDFGEYVCTASNDDGTAKSIFELEQGKMVPFFTQEPISYLSLTSLGKVESFKSIETSFRPIENDGLVMFLGDDSQVSASYISLALVAGRLQINFGTGDQDYSINGPNVELNQWHNVQITLQDSFTDNYKLIVDVDGEEIETEWAGRALNIKGYIYFAGLKNFQYYERQIKQSRGFKGCVSYLKLNNEKVDIGSEVYESVQVRECPVCENRPCKNGGSCSLANTPLGFVCECLDGFKGDNCEEVDNGKTAWGNIPLNGYGWNNPYYGNPSQNPYRPTIIEPSMGYGIAGERCNYRCENGAECIYSIQGIAMCNCLLGFKGELCEKPEIIDKGVELHRDGYLEVFKDIIFQDRKIVKTALQFKVDLSQHDSLLFWQSGYPTPYRNQDLFAIFVDHEGYLTFIVRSEGQEEVIKTDHRLSVARVYDVFFEINSRDLKVYLDDQDSTYLFRKPLNYLDLDTNVFIGGISSTQIEATMGRFSGQNALSGCIWDIYNPFKSVDPFNLSQIGVDGRNARSCH